MEIIDRIVMLLNEKGVEQKALAEHVSYKMRNENAKQKAGVLPPPMYCLCGIILFFYLFISKLSHGGLNHGSYLVLNIVNVHFNAFSA